MDDKELQVLLAEQSVRRLRAIDLDKLLAAVPKTLEGDAAYARVRFAHFHNRLPGDPTLINDVLYEMKANGALYEPLRSLITDKEYVKLVVTATVGAEHAIPTLAVLRSLDEARRYRFAHDCIIKPTHMSAQKFFVGPGDEFNWDDQAWWWTTNYYNWTGEANYRFLTPKVIVEPVLFGNHDITDYKVFCWHGEPKVIAVDVGRFSNHQRATFDTDWNLLPIAIERTIPDEPPERPAELAAGLEIARRLAQPFDFMRVDLYLQDGQVIVGELTNCPMNAGMAFRPEDGERLFSDLLFS